MTCHQWGPVAFLGIYNHIPHGVDELSHCSQVTPYGDIDWSQWLLRQREHQTINWTNVNHSTVRSSDFHLNLRAISQETPSILNTKILLKITDLKFYSNLPWASELTFFSFPGGSSSGVPAVAAFRGKYGRAGGTHIAGPAGQVPLQLSRTVSPFTRIQSAQVMAGIILGIGSASGRARVQNDPCIDWHFD